MGAKRKHQRSGMVDISNKEVTRRVARAVSTFAMSPKTFKALVEGGSTKGDVFETAKIAGIQAAKMTSSLIPMCHPLSLKRIDIKFRINKTRRSVVTTAEAVCIGQTGVEMEALVAASVASLTIYDMMKWSDKASVISETKLVHKRGGKSGDYNA